MTGFLEVPALADASELGRRLERLGEARVGGQRVLTDAQSAELREQLHTVARRAYIAGFEAGQTKRAAAAGAVEGDNTGTDV